MKVLILTITAGQGHNSTAKAIASRLEEMGAECKVLDTLYYVNRVLGDTVSKGYLLGIKAESAYRKAYRTLENRNANSYKPSMARLSNLAVKRKLRKFTDNYDPDVIVITHIFTGISIDMMKQLRQTRARTVGILTDFTFHPYWEEVLRFDYVVTANELLNYRAEQKGFRQDQILPFGIPIDSKYEREYTREEAAAIIGIDPSVRTLLLMGGSMGHGHLDEMVRELDNYPGDMQILCVCGSNKAGFERVEAIKNSHTNKLKKKLVNFGFTDKVEILMSASDCIISKPGGLSTSEALAKRLPMIIVDPIPGVEDRNTEFLLNCGAAIAVTETAPLAEALYLMFGFPERRELIKRSIELLRRPDSTTRLCRFIMDMEPLPKQQ